jgi:DNA-binding transcriptional MerR regulator
MTPDDLLTAGEVARALDVSMTRLRQIEAAGHLTPVGRVGRGAWRMYRRADVDAVVAARRQARGQR